MVYSTVLTENNFRWCKLGSLLQFQKKKNSRDSWEEQCMMENTQALFIGSRIVYDMKKICRLDINEALPF